MSSLKIWFIALSYLLVLKSTSRPLKEISMEMITWLIDVFPKYCYVNFQFSTWLCKLKLCLHWKFHIHAWSQVYSEQPRKKSMNTIWVDCMFVALIAIKADVPLKKSYLPDIWSGWPLSNKKCMVDMVVILHQNHQSNQTKWQNHCKWCGNENDCRVPSVAFMLFVYEAIGLRQWKSSWCGSILSQLYFLVA